MSNLSSHLLKALINDKLISAADLSKHDSNFGYEFNYDESDPSSLKEDNYYSELNKTIASVYSSELLEDYFNNNCFNIILSCIFNEAFKEEDAVKLTELIEKKGKITKVKDDIMLYQILLLPIYWVFYILSDTNKIILIKYFIKIKFYLALEVIYKNGFTSPYISPKWNRDNSDASNEIVKLIDESNDQVLLQKISDWYKTPESDEYTYSYLNLFIENACTNIIKTIHKNNHLDGIAYTEINKYESKEVRDLLIECITSDYNNISDVKLLEEYSDYSNIIAYLLFNRRLSDDAIHNRQEQTTYNSEQTEDETKNSSPSHTVKDTASHVYEYIENWFNKEEDTDDKQNNKQDAFLEYYNQITDHDVFNLLYYHECYNILAVLLNAGIEYTEKGNSIKLDKLLFDLQEGTSKTYTITLKSSPKSKLDLVFHKDSNISSGRLFINGNDIYTDNYVLTFESDNQNKSDNKYKEITFKLENDDVVDTKEIANILVTAKCDDPIYGEYISYHPVTVELLDNDTADISITGLNNELTEGASTQATVSLNTKPRKEVRATLRSDGDADITITPHELTFTNSKNSNEITITSNNDNIAVDKTTKIICDVTYCDQKDAAYEGISYTSDEITIKTNNKAGITYTNDTIELNESESVTKSFTLNSKPSEQVTLLFTLTDTSRLKLSKQSLSFNQDNWKDPQQITISAVENSIVDNTSNVMYIYISVNTTATEYKSIPLNSIKCIITDNDSPSINLSQSTFNLIENGDPKTCYVTLGTQPSDDVTINCTSDDQSDRLEISPRTLIINKDNWNKPTNILTFKSNDNDIIDDDKSIIVTLTATSNDNNYNNYYTTATVKISNDDNAGFNHDTSAINLQEGDSIIRSYSLKSKPTSDVTVNFESTILENRLQITPTILTFTPDNWSDAHNVIFKAIDNTIVDGNTIVEVNATSISDDSNYNNIKLVFNVNITDNDTYTWDDNEIGYVAFTTATFPIDKDQNLINNNENRNRNMKMQWTLIYPGTAEPIDSDWINNNPNDED